MRLSLRWQLTLWNTSALALGLLGFGLLVYALLGRAHRRIDLALLGRVDRSLERSDRMLAGSLQALQKLENESLSPVELDRALRHWIGEFKEHENVSCIVYDAAGKVQVRTEELAAQSIPAAPAATDESQFTDITVPILGHQRSLIRRLRFGGREQTVVLLASREELDREIQDVDRERREVAREMGQFLTVLFLAAPVAMTLAGGLGYFLARKALAPMENLDRLTRQITVAELDRRLPVANPDDELGRLTVTINEMIGRLERSFAEIRRFTADASHELRTPLTALRTEAEIALRRSLSPAEHRQILGSILEECERLTRLMDQLLTLSREDAAGRPAAEPLDLTHLVAEVVETMRPLAEVKKLRLQINENSRLQVRGDETRLREVFYNLLDNAIKYTPENGTIGVEATRKDGSAVVVVKDSGIGISQEHLPRVFDRFYRVDQARSGDAGGTGLGLSIARSIVIAHGGQIDLTSTPGQGTTCTVTLALEPAASLLKEVGSCTPDARHRKL